MKDNWMQYATDFSVMTDKEIERECEVCMNAIAEAEEWLEAVQSWKDAGKPRDATVMCFVNE